MQTINISLPKDLVIKADATAKREYKNRSELIREALRLYVSDTSDDFFDLMRKQAKYIIELEPGENDYNNINHKKAKPINKHDFL